jgi:capping protein alpha
MADEELSPAQKLAIAANFVLNSPPAQISNVMDDVRTLVGPSVLTPDKELALLTRFNKERFAAVDCGGTKVLITPHGEMPNGTFLDPSSGSMMDVDHKALTATKSAEPLSAAVQTSLDGARALRDAIDASMRAYLADRMPGAVHTTYGSTGNGIKVVCCVSGLVSELNNYWAGAWRSEWSLEVPMGGSRGTITGKVAVHVHYFEDGNVQLDDKAVFQGEIEATPEKVGPAFKANVEAQEGKFITKLEEIYAKLSEEVLQGLRRRLPVTRQKFDWDRIAVAKLAGDLQRAAAAQ